jgi:hypothetical protein
MVAKAKSAVQTAIAAAPKGPRAASNADTVSAAPSRGEPNTPAARITSAVRVHRIMVSINTSTAL